MAGFATWSLSKDDVANADENPFKGQLYNKPGNDSPEARRGGSGEPSVWGLLLALESEIRRRFFFLRCFVWGPKCQKECFRRVGLLQEHKSSRWQTLWEWSPARRLCFQKTLQRTFQKSWWQLHHKMFLGGWEVSGERWRTWNWGCLQGVQGGPVGASRGQVEPYSCSVVNV